MRKFGGFWAAAATIAVWSLGGSAAAEELSESNRHKFVQAPPGFVEACRRYEWLCGERLSKNQKQGGLRDPVATLELARDINRKVNRSIREVTDRKNYGKSDYWSLPRNHKGDCEDFVLMKYKNLLNAGLDQHNLSIAVVLTRKGENHAVLMLHLSSGDFVLDSLSPGVKLWNTSSYRFLAVQSRVDKRKWVLVKNSSKDDVVLAHR